MQKGENYWPITLQPGEPCQWGAHLCSIDFNFPLKKKVSDIQFRVFKEHQNELHRHVFIFRKMSLLIAVGLEWNDLYGPFPLRLFYDHSIMSLQDPTCPSFYFFLLLIPFSWWNKCETHTKVYACPSAPISEIRVISRVTTFSSLHFSIYFNLLTVEVAGSCWVQGRWCVVLFLVA